MMVHIEVEAKPCHMPDNSPLPSLQLWGVQYSCIAVSFNMRTGTISVVAPTWKSNIPRTCGFVHYSMGTPQVRQVQGRLSSALDCTCPKLYMSWRCCSATRSLPFCHLSQKVYNLDTLFLVLCSEYFYMVLFHEEIAVGMLMYYCVLLDWILELNLICSSVSPLKIFSVHSHLYSEYVVTRFSCAFDEYCISVRAASFPAQL